MIVVDASVAAKLYRDEPGSETANELFAAQAGQMHVPDILAVEVAGVIVRDANSDKVAAGTQREKLMHFAELMASPSIRLSRTEPFDIARSAELAIDLGHPLKDCLYLALAMQLGCPLVTADARFVAKAREVYAEVRGLEK